jgi:hypothetical protein
MAKRQMNYCAFTIEICSQKQPIVKVGQIFGLEFDVLKHGRIPVSIHATAKVALQPCTE